MTYFIVLAEWLHDNYEEIARHEGWETKKECQVLFEDLPEQNREVMMELAKRIIKKFNL